MIRIARLIGPLVLWGIANGKPRVVWIALSMIPALWRTRPAAA